MQEYTESDSEVRITQTGDFFPHEVCDAMP